MMLIEYGPIVTSMNAAPLHHYHSGQIEGSLGDSDYLCCNANPDLTENQTFNPDVTPIPESIEDKTTKDQSTATVDRTTNQSTTTLPDRTTSQYTTTDASTTTEQSTTTDDDYYYYDYEQQEDCR